MLSIGATAADKIVISFLLFDIFSRSRDLSKHFYHHCEYIDNHRQISENGVIFSSSSSSLLLCAREDTDGEQLSLVNVSDYVN